MGDTERAALVACVEALRDTAAGVTRNWTENRDRAAAALAAADAVLAHPAKCEACEGPAQPTDPSPTRLPAMSDEHRKMWNAAVFLGEPACEVVHGLLLDVSAQAAEVAALRRALQTIASGQLPDGDAVSMPVVMYAEEVLDPNDH